MVFVVNTPYSTFLYQLYQLIGSFLNDFYCSHRTCFCQMGFKFLSFCLINISKFRWQKSIYFSFLSQRRLIEWINLSFYFHNSFCYLKSKVLISKRSMKMKIQVNFYFDNFLLFFEIQGTLSINKFILDSYNQLKQCDLSKKTLYKDIIQSLTCAYIGLIWQQCAGSSDFRLWAPK